MKRHLPLPVLLLTAAIGAFAQSAIPQAQMAEPLNKAAYRVGPGDVLQISAGPAALRQESFARTEPVGPDGRISFDLIGSVFVENKTADEIDAELTRRLSEFIIDVEVTVVITSYQARRVFVLGEVNQPGQYLLSKNMSLLDALTLAGSPTIRASRGKIKLIRGNSTAAKPNIIRVDLNKITRKGEVERDLALADGDIIVVPPDNLSKFGYFLDKVLRPLQPLFYIGVITGLLNSIF
ncbi:MAG: polysaccharide export protein [candidate division KSB1 bacterium]|nr:polysaccharide export protein [candidate division KSB1 bacterium]MDZ7273632.1 polysaccharide export protein [candidate division KSB1 bacterium]MDZ7286777.1 polysaccharide export protein [candidate division KSB1 bacterium]MDZ7299866.1 polysaccharide export protein [candidate division KSB1 bacterium]MDZ7305803.1 polysaccharide export protein [candidate division KSB1 bacterium]